MRTRWPRHRRTAERGFTLVEILVAMTVLGLLLAMLTAGFRLAGRMSEAASVRLEAAADLALAQEFLQRRLTAARPVPASTGRQTVNFTGTAASLSFVAALPEALGGDLYRFAVGIDSTVSERPLVVLAAPLAEPAGTPERFVLLRHVGRLELAYLGPVDERSPETSSWQDRWFERTYLPDLVRIDAQLDHPPSTRWPTLFARPVIAGSTP